MLDPTVGIREIVQSTRDKAKIFGVDPAEVYHEQVLVQWTQGYFTMQLMTFLLWIKECLDTGSWQSPELFMQGMVPDDLDDVSFMNRWHAVEMIDRFQQEILPNTFDSDKDEVLRLSSWTALILVYPKEYLRIRETVGENAPIYDLLAVDPEEMIAQTQGQAIIANKYPPTA